jgi:hypothetical protein
MHEEQPAMLRLDDGEVLRLDPDQAQSLYAELWRVAAAVRGAISAAAKIRHAQANTSGFIETLEVEESAAVRVALDRKSIDSDDPASADA